MADIEAGNWVARLDQEAVIEAAGTKAFERLYALVKRGYRPDLDETYLGAVWLHHPSKRCAHPLVLLYPSGLVVCSGSNSDDFRFARMDEGEDDSKFQAFLRSVPMPNAWERSRDWRINVGVWMIIFGGGIIVWVVQIVWWLLGYK